MASNENPMDNIQRIYAQYNAQNPLCRFETVLYNKIPSSMNTNCFDKPPLIRSQVWDQGMKNNPDSSAFVAVGIRGYNELNERSNLCLAGHCSAIKRFEEISEKVNALRDQINIKTKQTIVDLKQSQIHLSHRLLAILRNYVCKMTADQSNCANLNSKEMKLKNVLCQMDEESKQLVHLYAHINKLSANLRAEHNANNHGESSKNFINNKSSMKQIFSFLKQQQQFVKLLADTTKNDIKDLNVIADTTKNRMFGEYE